MMKCEQMTMAGIWSAVKILGLEIVMCLSRRSIQSEISAKKSHLLSQIAKKGSVKGASRKLSSHICGRKTSQYVASRTSRTWCGWCAMTEVPLGRNLKIYFSRPLTLTRPSTQFPLDTLKILIQRHKLRCFLWESFLWINFPSWLKLLRSTEGNVPLKIVS